LIASVNESNFELLTLNHHFILDDSLVSCNNEMVNEQKNKQPGSPGHKEGKAKLAKAIANARTKMGKATKLSTAGLEKIKTAMGEASPEEVAEVLNDQIIPALEQIHEVAQEVTEALPVEHGNGGNGLEGLGGNDHGEDGGDDDSFQGEANEDDLNKMGAMHNGEDDEMDTHFEKLEATVKQLASENRLMKKAKMAQLWASNFPRHLRQAQEDEFMKEEDEEEEVMEAKLKGASAVLKAYTDAGMINSRTGSFPMHTAKQGLRTAKRTEPLPWAMR